MFLVQSVPKCEAGSKICLLLVLQRNTPAARRAVVYYSKPVLCRARMGAPPQNQLEGLGGCMKLTDLNIRLNACP